MTVDQIQAAQDKYENLKQTSMAFVMNFRRCFGDGAGRMDDHLGSFMTDDCMSLWSDQTAALHVKDQFKRFDDSWAMLVKNVDYFPQYIVSPSNHTVFCVGCNNATLNWMKPHEAPPSSPVQFHANLVWELVYDPDSMRIKKWNGYWNNQDIDMHKAIHKVGGSAVDPEDTDIKQKDDHARHLMTAAKRWFQELKAGFKYNNTGELIKDLTAKELSIDWCDRPTEMMGMKFENGSIEFDILMNQFANSWGFMVDTFHDQFWGNWVVDGETNTVLFGGPNAIDITGGVLPHGSNINHDDLLFKIKFDDQMKVCQWDGWWNNESVGMQVALGRAMAAVEAHNNKVGPSNYHTLKTLSEDFVEEFRGCFNMKDGPNMKSKLGRFMADDCVSRWSDDDKTVPVSEQFEHFDNSWGLMVEKVDFFPQYVVSPSNHTVLCFGCNNATLKWMKENETPPSTPVQFHANLVWTLVFDPATMKIKEWNGCWNNQDLEMHKALFTIGASPMHPEDNQELQTQAAHAQEIMDAAKVWFMLFKDGFEGNNTGDLIKELTAKEVLINWCDRPTEMNGMKFENGPIGFDALMEQFSKSWGHMVHKFYDQFEGLWVVDGATNTVMFGGPNAIDITGGVLQPGSNVSHNDLAFRIKFDDQMKVCEWDGWWNNESVGMQVALGRAMAAMTQ